MIENILERIAVALETIAAAAGAPQPAVTETEKPPAQEKKPTGTSKKAAKQQKKAAAKAQDVTYDQVAKAFVDLAKTAGKGKPACVEILSQFGFEKLPDMRDSDVPFGDVLAALEAARQ